MAQQPPAPPPPPPPPGPPPGGPVYAGGPAYGARPSALTAAAVIMFVIGGLRTLIYLLGIILILGASGEISELAGGGVGGLIAIAVVFALVAVVAGILQILGGTHTLRLRRRGRVLGLTGTIIGLALALYGLLTGGGGNAGGVVISLLLLLGDIAIIVLLAQNSRYLTNP
jgi:hypothetical protein